jgi:hypothetical protein
MKKTINQILDNKKYILITLIVVSFLVRLAAVFFARDFQIDNEWKVLLDNLVNNNSYSYYIFDNKLIPSALLPPLYPFFLYFIKTLTSLEGLNLINLIIFIQIILSTYSVYLFLQINLNFFNIKLSLLNSLIFSIIPLNIYACGQISSICLQVFFLLFFLKLLFQLSENQNNKNIIFFSLASSMMILIRGEFILFFILTIFFIYLYKKIKIINLLKIIIITILIISPYVARNYIQFNQFFIVKSLGYNLWKGNNQLSTVDGYENFQSLEFAQLNDKVVKIKQNKYYEISRDNIFLKEAISNITKEPIYYFKLYIKKIFSYFFIDINSKYPNYYNFLHLFPIIVISIISAPGFFVMLKMKSFKSRYIIFLLLVNLMIFSIFFILPRYKLAILPMQIILAAYFVSYILRKFKINIF